MNQTPPISNKVLFGYGVSMLPVMYAYILMLIMYMKYAVDDLGVSPALVGTIFLVAKIWDAVSDPLIGNLSDRTRHTSGRRRPWLYTAAPLIALFSIMAWAPPTSLTGTAQTIWLLVAVLGFYTAFTMFDVPHLALGAEVTLNTKERNKVFGVRQFMKILGTAGAGILGTYLVAKGEASATTMAYGMGLLTMAIVFGGISLLPPERESFQGRGGGNAFKAVRDVWGNPHARLLLMVVFIDAIGVGGIGVLMPFLVEYVVKDMSLLPAFMGLNMLGALAMVPGWVWLARRFPKHKLLLWSFVLAGTGYGLILFVGEGSWLILVFCCVMSGGGNTCMHVLGSSLKSEIIDCDEYETGDRKEGSFFAAWSFMNKLGHGIMVGVVGLVLQWSDFQPNVVEQTHVVKQSIVVMMGGVPLFCLLAGALAFTRFGLTPDKYAEVRAKLDARNGSSIPEAG